MGYEKNLDRGELIFKYKLLVSGETLEFAEKIILPDTNIDKVPQELLNKIFDSLLLVLGISYWKLYCPQNVVVKIPLSKEQGDFWNALYINGLGEFFYKNKIDFRTFKLFSANTESSKAISFPRENRSLLGVGGGKDSIVSAELLKQSNKEFTAFTLDSHPIQNKIGYLIGVDKILVKREIDPKLFELNKRQDVYNGHIPISAIYHFVGVLLGILYDYKYIIFSNEKSANYGNVDYLGKRINHQWSKSFEFEKMLQDYVSKFVTPDVYPFSLLRSMNEIKVTELFSQYPSYFSTFSSCNRNFRINERSGNLWCGECAKCLFMFCALSAFLSKDELTKIFGQNLFEKQELSDKYEELLGLQNHKPFDCVGTPEEVKLAFYLAYKKGEYNGSPVVQMFESSFGRDFSSIEESSGSLLSITGDNNVPQEFQEVLSGL